MLPSSRVHFLPLAPRWFRAPRSFPPNCRNEDGEKPTTKLDETTKPILPRVAYYILLGCGYGENPNLSPPQLSALLASGAFSTTEPSSPRKRVGFCEGAHLFMVGNWVILRPRKNKLENFPTRWNRHQPRNGSIAGVEGGGLIVNFWITLFCRLTGSALWWSRSSIMRGSRSQFEAKIKTHLGGWGTSGNIQAFLQQM